MRYSGCLLGVVLLAACGERAPWLKGGGNGGAPPTSTDGDGGLFTGGADTGGAGTACNAGVCVGSAAGPFLRVTMISTGKPEEVKPCPSWAPMVFEGHAGMAVDLHACPACSCGPAACALPEEMHASAAKCAMAEGAASIAWDAAPAWEGGCSGEDPVAASLQCSGVPCVQSLTLDAPMIEPCKPAEQGAAPFPAPAWATMARECKVHVEADGDGCPDGETCAPVPPEGFVLCLSVAGEGYECPPEYPDALLVFDSVADSRGCSPCSCSEPAGADCAALVSVFSDGACGALLGTYLLANEEPGCHDLPSGSALGSKSASFVVDEPGTCVPSGGDAVGELHPAGPVTFCCQPPATPAK